MKLPGACWLAFGLLLGCQREAPGPAECRKFALSAVGVTTQEELALPQVNRRVEDLTLECLTAPYDRELLRCYEITGQARACQFEFKNRQRSRSWR